VERRTQLGVRLGPVVDDQDVLTRPDRVTDHREGLGSPAAVHDVDRLGVPHDVLLLPDEDQSGVQDLRNASSERGTRGVEGRHRRRRRGLRRRSSTTRQEDRRPARPESIRP
jgi:hypothetical protein